MSESSERAAVEAAVIRLNAWLTGRRANVNPEISTTLVRAEPYDRTSSSYTIAESDLRTVLAELGQIEKRFAEMSDGMSVAAELLGRLADDAECMVDHEGCNEFCLPDHRNLCLAHNEALPCPHPLARDLVGAWREVQKAADS